MPEVFDDLFIMRGWNPYCKLFGDMNCHHIPEENLESQKTFINCNDTTDLSHFPRFIELCKSLMCCSKVLVPNLYINLTFEWISQLHNGNDPSRHISSHVWLSWYDTVPVCTGQTNQINLASWLNCVHKCNSFRSKLIKLHLIKISSALDTDITCLKYSIYCNYLKIILYLSKSLYISLRKLINVFPPERIH